MKRRFLAVLLAAMMVCSLLPVTAGAAEESPVLFSVYNAENEKIYELTSVNGLQSEELYDILYGEIRDNRYVTFVQEQDISLTAENENDAFGVFLYAGSILNMNGHSITLNANSLGMGMAVTISGKNLPVLPAEIRNGTIILLEGGTYLMSSCGRCNRTFGKRHYNWRNSCRSNWNGYSTTNIR